jgi:tRNA-dihydrouridine synthase
MADSENFAAVPQVLTKVAENFLWAASVCADRGYDEVNLNVGCPSGTVVSKGKGSGMLRDVNALDAFLQEIFAKSPLPISVKTRLGLEDPAEFPAILEVFNRYPIKELTVHPRVRKQFYDGGIFEESFDFALKNSQNTLCFNGDIATLADISRIQEKYPQVQAIMIGRGLVGNPGMLAGGTKVDVLEKFHNELLDIYTDAFGGGRNAIFRLKENWHFLITHFEDSEKLWKRLRKTTDLNEFRDIATQIFHTKQWNDKPISL